jgi:beta-glucosidase
MEFPQGFTWGAATSSYQVEGAAYRDGGGYSVWDMLGRHAGKIAGGDTGEIACDHYHRFREDVGLMAEIGLKAYRFSVSWPRVLPAGSGRINRRGLDFYDRLVDALLRQNIEPWLTLFHWDFPYELYCRGGWLNRDSADWFADYSAVVVDRLSDRVAHWSTLNEPQVFIGLGHLEGSHAPGLSMAVGEALRAAHHALLAHGKAVQAIRARARGTPCIGASHAGNFFMPAGDGEADIDAARRRNFAIIAKDFFNNSWFSDPMILGRYPDDGLDLFAADMPRIADGDMRTICQPLDYFGCNVYFGSYGRAGADGGFETVDREGIARTDLDWPVTPEVLYWAPRFYTERYALPLVVTESGMANADQVREVVVDDEARIEFLKRYLCEYARAIADGVPGIGYFVWSLLDNFEWAQGYAKRFGIVYVDYRTQRRRLKQSALWYRRVIADNAISPCQPPRPRQAVA